MTEPTPSELIDGRIAELGDWRGDLLARLRGLIHRALPGVVEEWKWRGVPVWYQDGMICTGETYKAVVKLTFAKGAALEDPARLFNASLEGNVRRAIDFAEGSVVDEDALIALFRAAAALNAAKAKKKGCRLSLPTSPAKAGAQLGDPCDGGQRAVKLVAQLDPGLRRGGIH